MYTIVSSIPIYFSFCIYGTNLMYYKGLLKNLEIVSQITPQPAVIIGYGDDIIEEYKNKFESYNFVKLIKISEKFNEYTMCSRLLQIDIIKKPVYVFCRDADSRISERDLWCIQSFINSGKKLHIIRDHYFHKQKIMGGMCGFLLDSISINFTELFSNSLDNFKNLNKSYGFDEQFLSANIYTLFSPEDIWINSNCSGLLGENINTIDIPQKDDTDFIGNVYNEDESTQFSYSHYITFQHLEWLATQQQWNLILLNSKYVFEKTNSSEKHSVLLFLLNTGIIAKDLLFCLEYCKEIEFHHINDNLIQETNRVLELARELGYKIVATTDIMRKPQENEFVICYGQYPHTIECIPTSSRILYRHPIYFNNINHTQIEYNKCWESISTIYILNLEERRDRYMNILVELCRVNAPLNRIYHYKAQKTSYLGNRSQDAYIGATNNHLDAIRDFIQSGNDHCLILEDDITFISDINHIHNSLKDFFNNPIDYDVCFLSYSKFGEVRKYNDLLSVSYQNCTTSSAYLVNKNSVSLIENCFQVGVDEMKKGGEPHIYCCDRYWNILQSRNKMFLFRRKLGFQIITHSDITNNINYNFD
jgi:hypothetical protein